MLSAKGKNNTLEQIASAFEEFQQALAFEGSAQSNKQTRIRELMHSRSILSGYSESGIFSFVLKKTPYPKIYKDGRSTAGG